MNDWTTSYDKQPKEGTDIIYTDFQKAFDSVQNKRLLHKLSVYGIQGKLLNWIKSFLTNRRQRVLLNGSPSDWEAVVTEVPQGTIMGPIFFLLFVNDVPNTLNCKVMLFADDAKLYSTINEEQDCINLQADLELSCELVKGLVDKFQQEKMCCVTFQ